MSIITSPPASRTALPPFPPPNVPFRPDVNFVEVPSACDGSEEAPDWQAWVLHLRKRQSPTPLGTLLGIKGDYLTWGGLELCTSLPTPHNAPTVGLPSQHPLVPIAWSHALPKLARAWPAHDWWQLFNGLVAMAHEPCTSVVIDDPLVQQWRAAELPLALVYLFPELRQSRQLSAPGWHAFARGLEQLLDVEGLPRCRHLPLVRPLLACWTRCLAMAGALVDPPSSDEFAQVRAQLARFTLQAIRLTRRDGSQALSADSSLGADHVLFDAAVGLTGDEDAKNCLAVSHKARRTKGSRPVKCPPLEASAHSEWSEIAVMRPTWSASSPRLTVAYGGPEVQAELELAGELLWSGEWNAKVCANGAPLEPDGDWEEVCWLTNDAVDYLEIERALTNDVRIQRQFLLARNDLFLLAADVVLCEQLCDLDYVSRLALGADASFQPEPDTRDGMLCGKRGRARVLPLAIPEWRRDLRGGSLSEESRALKLQQTSRGVLTLYAPLFVDLDPRRRSRPVTWRQLTVAEDRVAQPADEAVGYRIQIGKEQWIVYRSLADVGNRTLMGHNLVSQFLTARFSRTGEVEAIVEVE